MENVWFTSDTHHWHDRIREFCPDTRRGESTEEMTELLIEAHNSVVKPGDRVYHMGDFCFKGKTQIESVKRRLNGQIHLIFGNHDRVIKKSAHLSGLFASVRDYRFIKIQEQHFALSHFPMARWENMGKGSIMLFGHTHGGYKTNLKSMDVGIDARPDNKMLPWHIDEILEMMTNRDVIDHHDA